MKQILNTLKIKYNHFQVSLLLLFIISFSGISQFLANNSYTLKCFELSIVDAIL